MPSLTGKGGVMYKIAFTEQKMFCKHTKHMVSGT